ncbi:VIP3 protein [Planoprotostelium fungivorum]|uniref:VIP3 protein n=1 Tax=Planoprotostelium fungivorum TaxID=1890364 RepID=A0A2P6NZI3_9EUKA|nr:VIP3 protein [Planoprotostelium fungivorum]
MVSLHERRLRLNLLDQLNREEEVEAEVNREDQDNINAFGRLNLRLHDIRDELNLKQEYRNNVQDANNELLLGDDEEVRYRMGETFVLMSKDEVTALLERDEENINSDIDKLNEEAEQIQKDLSVLKAKLYAKFKSSINLEEDPHALRIDQGHVGIVQEMNLGTVDVITTGKQTDVMRE